MPTELEPHKILRITHANGTITFLGGKFDQRAKELTALSTQITPEEVQDRLKNARFPLRGAPRDIIGWGGMSVSQRFTDEKGRRFACTMRPLHPDQPLGYLLGILREEQLIGRRFHPYFVPADLVLMQGLDQRPAVLKISPEVSGAVTSDLSFLYLMRSPQLLAQYADLFSRNLALFARDGVIANTKGHISTHPLVRKFEGLGFLPFLSDNLMVDFSTDSLKMIDSDVSYTLSFKRVPWHIKAQILGQCVGSAINIGLAETFRAVNSLRNRCFPNPTEQAQVEKIKGYWEFKQGFEDTINLLNKAGLQYRVLGSFAVAGSIQTEGGNYFLSPRRSNGSLRDIDILLLDADPSIVEELTSTIQKKRIANLGFPEVSFHFPLPLASCNSKDWKNPRFVPTTYSAIAKDGQGRIFMACQDTIQEIPSDYLISVARVYDGMEFPTVRAGVLAGFALTRYGAFRSKDIEKITQLLAQSGDRMPVEFLDYAKSLRSKHRDWYRNYLLLDLLYHFTGGHLPEAVTGPIRAVLKKVRRSPTPEVGRAVA